MPSLLVYQKQFDLDKLNRVILLPTLRLAPLRQLNLSSNWPPICMLHIPTQACFIVYRSSFDQISAAAAEAAHTCIYTLVAAVASSQQ